MTEVETTKGLIAAETICLAVAGHSSHLAAMAGLRLPIESHVLQAFVSESIKPVLDVVLTYGAGHFYVSQSDKGGLVFGGATDGYNTYGQRGTLPMAEEVAAAAVTLLPALARVKILRQWGGVMDMSMDGSPIISKTPVDGLILNGGWCYGGFKAIPAGGMTTAHLIAHKVRPSRRSASGSEPLRTRDGPSMSAAPVRFLTRTEIPCCAFHVPTAASVTRSSFAIGVMRAHRDRSQKQTTLRHSAAFVYERDNPRGWHLEWWLHVGGCRKLLKVERHTLSHEIRAVDAADILLVKDTGR